MIPAGFLPLRKGSGKKMAGDNNDEDEDVFFLLRYSYSLLKVMEILKREESVLFGVHWKDGGFVYV